MPINIEMQGDTSMQTGQLRGVRLLAVAFAGLFCAALLVLVSVTAAFPSASVLDAARTSRLSPIFEAETKFAPNGISSTTGLAYNAHASDAYSRAETLDAYTPTAAVRAGERLPAIVWIHGGGWIGGSAEELASHLKIVAAHGYTTVGVNYTLAPDARYPLPLHQIMAALTYVQQHAARLHVDPTRIVLAGDSAGAQLAAQTAAFITDPAYARQVGVAPTLEPSRLRAVVLYCGVFDWSLTGVHGHFRSYLQEALLEYTHSHHPGTNAVADTGSVVHHVSPSFPPAFVTAGNADPVLAQSLAFADALKAQQVTVDRLFFPSGYRPALTHEYEFRLGTTAARTALTRMLTFIAQHTAP